MSQMHNVSNLAAIFIGTMLAQQKNLVTEINDANDRIDMTWPMMHAHQKGHFMTQKIKDGSELALAKTGISWCKKSKMA